MVQAVYPYMLKARQAGKSLMSILVDLLTLLSCSLDCSVVNIASISAHRAQPDRWTYASSKGAIVMLTKSMVGLDFFQLIKTSFSGSRSE